jgi:hypothetical protein
MVFVFTRAILTGVAYLIVVLICVSLVISDVVRMNCDCHSHIEITLKLKTYNQILYFYFTIFFWDLDTFSLVFSSNYDKSVDG